MTSSKAIRLITQHKFNTVVSFLISGVVFSLPSPRFFPLPYGLLLKGVAFAVLIRFITSGVLPFRRREFFLLLLVFCLFCISLLQGVGSLSELWNDAGIQYTSGVMFKGLAIYAILSLYYRSRVQLSNFVIIFVVTGIFLACISRLGPDNQFLDMLFNKSSIENGLGDRDNVLNVSSAGFEYYRLTFFSMDTNYLGTVMGMTLLGIYFISLGDLLGRSKYPICLLASMLVLPALLGAGSRGAFLQFLAGLIAMYFTINKPSIKNLIIIVCSIFLSIVILKVAADKIPAAKIAEERVTELFDSLGRSSSRTAFDTLDRADNTMYIRVQRAIITLEYFYNSDYSLLLGTGGKTLPGGNHIGYVLLLYRLGILGFLAFLALNFYIFRSLKRGVRWVAGPGPERDYLKLVGFALGMHTMVLVKLLSDPIDITMWFVLSFSSVVAAIRPRHQHQITTSIQPSITHSINFKGIITRNSHYSPY